MTSPRRIRLRPVGDAIQQSFAQARIRKRWTSGFPYSVGDGFFFPTNWDQGRAAVLTGEAPETGIRVLLQHTVAEEAGFDVLLTTDKNLAYQQNLNNRKIATVALGRNRWSLIQPALPRIAGAVYAVKPGSYTLVEIPDE